MEVKHVNSGNCAKCGLIFNRYPGFHAGLKAWFFSVTKKFPNFHIADAGRGRLEQELYFHKGASRAHYGESAHNVDAAIDTFFLVNGEYSLDEKLYEQLMPLMTSSIAWYGSVGAPFKERPHFEVVDWKNQVASGKLKLVEEEPVVSAS